MNPTTIDEKREFLRHTLATLAYRGGKVLRDAPEGFSTLTVRDGTRTPLEILAHIGDLFDWSLSLVRGEHAWNERSSGSWEVEVARFFEGIKALDDYLGSSAPLGFEPERIFQGPVADALTHVGQLAMLRRIANAPVRRENYFKADIRAGSSGI